MSDDDSGSTIELNRRRVLAGLGTIGLASAGAGAGTMALFSDTETSSGNAVQAGTLDLSEGVTSESFSVGRGGSKEPGSQGTAYFALENAGTLDGSLDFSLGSASVSQANSPESADEGVTRGEFDITVGTTGGETNFPSEEDPFGEGDLISLNEAGLNGPQETTVDETIPEVSVETAGDLNAAASGSAEVVFDTDNDGEEDIRVGVQPGKAAQSENGNEWNADGFYYKKPTDTGYTAKKPVNTGADTPSEVESVSYDGDTFTVELDGTQSNVSTSGIAIGGQVIYPDNVTGSDFDGNQLYTPIVPFKAEGDTFGQGGPSGPMLLPVDGTLRRLDDVLLTSLSVDPDFGGDGDIRDDDETLVAEGRLSRIDGMDYDTNASLSSTKYLVLEYQIPYDASNAIQGEEVTFDITAELNQEDSQ